MNKGIAFVGLCAALLVSQTAHAGGFALLEQSAEGVGTAFSGGAGGYGDGSEVFLNPAAMSRIDKITVSASTEIISPRADFSNEGSQLSFAPIPLSGADDKSSTVDAVPNFYVVVPVDDWRFGFGVNAPFGLRTKYDDPNWVGRYHATNSELMTVNLTPAVSYTVFDDSGTSFAIGAGLNIYYLDATLENAVDFGTIGFATLGAQTASQLGLAPQQNDGYAKVKGSDWATGFTLGGSFNYDTRSTVGVAWHTRVQSTLDGDATFTVPSAAKILTSSGLFTDAGASAGVQLPESVAVGGTHWLNDDWALMYETQWTRWSRFEELRVQFDSVQPDSVTNENWDNTWRFSVGGKYRATDRLSVRAGTTWDNTPVSDAEHRTPRIPDQDRFWLATGVSYQLTDNIKADLSYAHLFVRSADTNVSSASAGALNGTWDSGVDIVGIGLIGTFG